ncbi:hypothetical protein VTN00DRAFT_5459 [Thermoascus crustaceus]|uniref:uncharacterized protein n=1 Tax=Thermoascus crustaceus TaxID=5088 RepID=UPI003743A7FC
MATTGPRAQKPVGSAAWIAAEKENVMNLVDQEMEEVEYPVRHEMEWLNEHMAEIFSSNQFNVTEIFKTPGKLRGKTPRTARKRNVDEARVPLSDIFSSNHQLKVSANPGPLFAQPTKPAANNEAEKSQRSQDHKPNQNLNSFPKYNTDSGYHGMPDDEEDDVVLPGTQPESQSSTQPLEATQPLETTQRSQDTQDTQPTQSLHDTQPLEEEPEEEPEAESEAEPEEEREAEPEERPEAELEEEPDEEPEEPEAEPEKGPTPAARNVTSPSPDRRRTSEGSFHSAQEDIRQREETVEPMNVDSPARQKIEVQIPQPSQRPSKDPEPAQSPARLAEKTAPAEPAKSQPDEKESKNTETALDNQFDDIGSPSDNSTPERPLIRKSSLTFASLPAREPLNTKKSMGGTRISRTSHIDLGKMSAAGRQSYFGRQTGGPRTTQVVPEEDDEKKLDKMDVDDEKGLSHDDSDMDMEASKLHNKSSTQRLHEKISMLGKLQPSRPTKSIPAVSALASSQVTYPELPSTQQETSKQGTTGQRPRSTQSSKPAVGDNDEWIKPMSSPLKANLPKSHTTGHTDQPTGSGTGKDDLEKSRSIEDSPAKRHPEAKPSNLAGLGHGKSASTPTLSSPQRPGTPAGPNDKDASASDVAVESTTPPVSPRRYEGPLSASRSKLQSIMKTARGLFTGSAGTPVPGRMEPSSPIASRSQPNPPQDNTASGHEESQPPEPSSPLRQEGRRTRNSTEREEKRKEQELKDRQRMDEKLEKAREQERQKAAESKTHQEKPLQREDLEAAPATKSDPNNASHSQKQPSREPEHSREPEPKFATPAVSHHQQPQQTSKQNDRRPVKPTRETQQRPKPQPVSIRVGSTLSRQMPLSTNSSSSVQDPAPAPTPASTSKHPTISKKTSTSSLHTTASASSFKSTISTQSQRKAQLAAERKREQEEREARRREEQKRELERKRAAQQQQQQEEARRQELRNRAEAERRERERERLAMEEAKKAAQKQAIEKRRLENARRHERQGSQQPNSANDSQDRTAPHSAQRNDLGPARPASRLGSVQPFSRSINQPPPNPAKPPKRVLEEDTSARSAASKPSAVYQAAESKRRKTEDEHNPLPPIRPTMAPPIRQSNIRKEPAKPAIFPYNYVPAPPPAAHHQTGSSLFKNPSASHHAQQPGPAQPQRPGHPMDMAKYTTGKIPFADASNSAQASAPHRTPGQSSQKAPVKESPRYPSGETIHLPEIPTDSEDEDSDAEMFPVPKWAQPKELEAILREQEGKDSDSIFGPIAPFSLEETFKADKKAKKFRERTSSANWGGADGLTQEEIRRDIAERQRLRMNGGWTFTPQ